jgi:hypothetical protein
MRSCFKDGRNVHSGKQYVGVQDTPTIEGRYFIPQQLIKDILTDFFDNYKGASHGKTPPPNLKADPTAQLSREFGETLTTKKK